MANGIKALSDYLGLEIVCESARTLNTIQGGTRILDLAYQNSPEDKDSEGN
jgi:hypothetical protein